VLVDTSLVGEHIGLKYSEAMKWLRGVWKLIQQVWGDVEGSLKSPKPLVIVSLSIVLIAIGSVGILIPLFPGLVILIPGIMLLSLYSPTVYKRLKRKVSGHPKAESITDRTRNWLINLIRPRQ
jgi:hypothetical protein